MKTPLESIITSVYRCYLRKERSWEVSEGMERDSVYAHDERLALVSGYYFGHT